MTYSSFKNEGVWKYFLRSGDKQTAQCTLCKKVMKVTQGSTKGLHTHIACCHREIVLKDSEKAELNATSSSSNDKSDPPLIKKQKVLTDFLHPKDSQTLEAVVSRLIAVDGLPLSVFVTSSDLRALLSAKGFTVPRSKSTIKAIVSNYAANLKKMVTKEIQEKRKDGYALSLTLDEYTSVKNRRYLNINVFFKCRLAMYFSGV